MKSLAKVPEWQRKVALLLHTRFAEIDLAVVNGAKVSSEIDRLTEDLEGETVQVLDDDGDTIDERPVRASRATLWRKWTVWIDGGKTPQAILPGYRSAGHHQPVPPELVAEIQRIATNPTGGRNKKGLAPAAHAWNEITRQWREGKHIPGLGTWRDWWVVSPRTSGLPIPPEPPEFPWCKETVCRKVPSKALRAGGNVGEAAMRKHLTHIERDYSQLKKSELFTLDDVRLDVAAIDEFTGQVVVVTAYIFMEVGSRFIPSFIVRPAKGIKARDVDSLIAAGLETCGVGVGYQTHILFERGTVACSTECQAILEGGTGNRIKVHRTGMIEGVKWIGQAADKARGNAAGKAVIESFNRSLHYRLLHLPGQLGNNWGNSPSNLGIEDRAQINGGFAKKRATKEDDKRRKDPSKESLVERTERLARFKRQAAIHGIDCDIEFPMMTVAQLEAEVQKAIEDHNKEPGHDYQGHHTRPQAEVAPGVYEDLNP